MATTIEGLTPQQQRAVAAAQAKKIDAARQARAQEARYMGNLQPVVTAPTGAAGSPSTGTFGQRTATSGGAGSAVTSAAAAAAAANSAARSSANQNKTSLQQSIDAAFAQMGTNKAKLDALNNLVATGLGGARDTKLSAITKDLQLLLDQAMANYGDTLGDLNTGLRSNEKAEADSTFANLANRAREKQDLVTQALSMGAGESDVLKTQLQALRNWDANQGDVNRSYFDTMHSTNAALTDLNVGTKSNMTGFELDANQRQSQVWDDFYGGMADAYTQMDNLATNNYLLEQEIQANQKNMEGQNALVAWLDAGKNAADFVAQTTATGQPTGRDPYKGYAQQAAEFAGKAWQSPGVSAATQNWEGQEAQNAGLNSGQLAATNQLGPKKKKPEGATLRRW